MQKSKVDVYLTAFAAGVAAGVLGSRLLPPLLSSGAAARRTSQGDDPFEQLIEDHREIVQCLTDMEQLGPDAKVRRMTSFLKFKRTLAKHAMAEEDVVYPLLMRQEDSSKHLYDEHADMKITLYRLEELIKQNADWREDVQRLRHLIESHIEEEESVAFPLLRQKLDEHRLPEMSGQISREEALVL
jgi:hemerythrin-like domain-containing protein